VAGGGQEHDPQIGSAHKPRTSLTQSDGFVAVRQHLLVPRNLIPANPHIGEAVEASGAVDPAAASRRLMVPRLLVPPGVRIGTAAEPGGSGGACPVARVNVFDEALLGKSSLSIGASLRSG